MAYQLSDLIEYDLSVAMTAETDQTLGLHLHKSLRQEDLAFAYWAPSVGRFRFSAIISTLILPEEGERVLQGNVAFLPEYLERVLENLPRGAGIAFMHGHLGPGWQAMSDDDVVAERDRLAGVVAGVTGLPLVGLTRGTDGAWSARFWARSGPRTYERRDARTVRVVGQALRIIFHPSDVPPKPTSSQVETINVWGARAHADLARARVGIAGLGSVGSLAAEGCSRLGVSRPTYIDHDLLEMRNLDRTHGATVADVLAGLTKVAVAARATALSHTSSTLDLRVVPRSILTTEGFEAALDCDVLLSCVDRPLPRHLLNSLAFAHLIPVVDGGIFAQVTPKGTPQHVAWRIHSVGPERACMVCLGALRRSDVALDREGKLDDPDYVAGLSEHDKAVISRRNVFPFSMAVAAHQVLQMVGLVTGFERIGGAGPQVYDAYPGEMAVLEVSCDPDCEYVALTATAANIGSGVDE